MGTSNASAWKTLMLVGAVSVGAAVLVTGSYELSRDRIAANERERLLARLYSVLPPPLRDAGLEATGIMVSDPLLGSGASIDVFVVTDANDAPQAVIFASVARNGYNGPIRLLIGVTADGVVSGVRVLSHRETPGLGDAIELRKSDWILDFDGRSLGDPPRALWAVEPDGGDFDALTGATVTPRAVVESVRDTLVYFERERDALIAQAAEAALAAEP